MESTRRQLQKELCMKEADCNRMAGQVREMSQLQERLQGLQPLPEMLKQTELQLHESEDLLRNSERKNAENAIMNAEQSLKVTDSIAKMKEELDHIQSVNHSLKEQVIIMERQLQDKEFNQELLTSKLARKEEALHHCKLHLEVREGEKGSLTCQLEETLTFLHRQQEQSLDKQAAMKRTFRTRVVDLESQISQTRAEMGAEVTCINREKDEAERRFKDNLEQAHRANCSMQNYMQILKRSNANDFLDGSLLRYHLYQ